MLLLVTAASSTCFTETALLSGDAQKLELYLTVTESVDENPACVNFEGNLGQATLYLSIALPNGTTELASNEVVYSNLKPQTFVFDMAGTSQSDFNTFVRTEYISYSVEIGISRPMSGAISKIEYSKSDVSNCWNQIDFEYSIITTNRNFVLHTQPNLCYFTGQLKANLRFQIPGEFVENLPYFISSSAPGEYNVNYDHENTFKFALDCAEFTADEADSCNSFFVLLEEHIDLELSLVLEYIENGVEIEIIGDISEEYTSPSSECFAYADPDVDVYENSVVVSLVEMYNLTGCIVDDFDSVEMQLYLFNDNYSKNSARELTKTQYAKDIIFAVSGNFTEFLETPGQARFRFILRKNSDIVHAVVREQPGRVYCVYQMETKLTRSQVHVFMRYYPYNSTCKSGQVTTVSSFNFYKQDGLELVLVGRSKVNLTLDFDKHKIQKLIFRKRDFNFTVGDFDSVIKEGYTRAKNKTALVDVYNSLFFIYTTNVFIYGDSEFALIMGCFMALIAVFAAISMLFVYGICGKKEVVEL